MQCCSDYGFYGVVGREEGGEQNPHELKKSLRFLPLPSFSLKNGFHFVVHLFNKTLQMLQDAQQFQSLLFWSCDIVRVMLTSLTDFNNFPKLAKYQQNNVEL